MFGLVVAICAAMIDSARAEAFWWEKVKAPKFSTKQFDKVAGGRNYMFIEFYTKSCGYCQEFYPQFNKVYDDFNGPNALRNDITIIKVDGEESADLADRYGISSYPNFILLFPNDYVFPQKYLYKRDYKTMRDYLNTVPKVENPDKSKEISTTLNMLKGQVKQVV